MKVLSIQSALNLDGLLQYREIDKNKEKEGGEIWMYYVFWGTGGTICWHWISSLAPEYMHVEEFSGYSGVE